MKLLDKWTDEELKTIAMVSNNSLIDNIYKHSDLDTRDKINKDLQKVSNELEKVDYSSYRLHPEVNIKK